MTDTPASAVAVHVRNLCAVKAVFQGDYNGARGCFLLLMDLDENRVDRLHAIIATDPNDFRFQPRQEWKSFEDEIIRAKLGGNVAQQMGMEVQSYMKKIIKDDLAAEVASAIRHRNPEDVKRMMTDVISKAIADAQVLIDLSLEAVEEEIPVEPEKKPDEIEEASPAPVVTKDVTLKVEPILAPVQGVPAKLLKPGMQVVLEMKEHSTLKQNVSKLLTTRVAGSDRGTLVGTVLEVLPGAEHRVLIRFELAPNVIGLSKLFGDLKVLVQGRAAAIRAIRKTTPSADLDPGGITTRTFVMAVIAIFTIMAILTYLIFVEGVI